MNISVKKFLQIYNGQHLNTLYKEYSKKKIFQYFNK